jgi:hypothetical protein
MLAANRSSQMRFAATLLVVVSFLALGVFLGRTAGQQWTPLAGPTSAPQSETYLVLGYDQLTAPAHLLAVWIVQLQSSGQAKLLGISPSTIVFESNGQPAVLKDALGDPQSTNPNVLHGYLKGAPDAVIEMDNQAFETVANRLGGVFLDGRALRGQDVVDALLADQDSPLEALAYEAKVLRALALRVPPGPEEFILAGLGPDHVRSTIPLDRLVSENESRLPTLSTHIQVDTLDNVSSFALPGGGQGLLPNPPLPNPL